VKRFLFFCAVLLAAATGSSVAANLSTAPTSPLLSTVDLLAAGRPVKIVCLGDSITGVYYHTGGRRAWADLVGIGLRQIYPRAQLEMINAGVSGNTTVDALKRLDADVLSHRPQLVMVMLGMNDVAKVPADVFRANLGEIVDRARRAGAEVILLTPTLVSPGDPSRPLEKVSDFAQITREVGRALHVPVTDTFRAFQSIQAVDHRAWIGLMSDTIHPNMRGHKVLAEEALFTLTGRRVFLGELPALQPGLPRLLARLQAKQPVRVVATKPYDTLIAPALRRLYPNARVEVTAWDPAGRSLADIEEQAKAMGWLKYRDRPTIPRPDLFLVAVPAAALASSEDQYFHAYTWIMNWSLSFGPPGWDCLVLLPSVAEPEQDQAQQAAEKLALEVVRGQDLPWLRRAPGDSQPAEELLSQKLAQLLEIPSPGRR
jgi:lysophospholipase L1-like esterase